MSFKKITVMLLWLNLAGTALAEKPSIPLMSVNLFPGRDAGARIAACIAALPPTGGTCDARMFGGDQSISQNVFQGITKAGVLLLGNAVFNTSVTQTPPSNWEIAGPRSSGTSPGIEIPRAGAVFKWTGGSGGVVLDLFGVQNTKVQGIAVDCNDDTSFGKSVTGVRISSVNTPSTQRVSLEDWHIGNGCRTAISIGQSAAQINYQSDALAIRNGFCLKVGDCIYSDSQNALQGSIIANVYGFIYYGSMFNFNRCGFVKVMTSHASTNQPRASFVRVNICDVSLDSVQVEGQGSGISLVGPGQFFSITNSTINLPSSSADGWHITSINNRYSEDFILHNDDYLVSIHDVFYDHTTDWVIQGINTFVSTITGYGLTLPNKFYWAMGNPPDGTLIYCSDCTATNPCAAGGQGAVAKRIHGGWVCN